MLSLLDAVMKPATGKKLLNPSPLMPFLVMAAVLMAAAEVLLLPVILRLQMQLLLLKAQLPAVLNLRLSLALLVVLTAPVLQMILMQSPEVLSLHSSSR